MEKKIINNSKNIKKINKNDIKTKKIYICNSGVINLADVIKKLLC